MEQVMGIEPTTSAWKAEVLPLYDTCISNCFAKVVGTFLTLDSIDVESHTIMITILSFVLIILSTFNVDTISIAVIMHIDFCLQSCIKGFVL